MKRRRKTSADTDRGKYRDLIQAWRRHPEDPWLELERLGLTDIIGQLGWSQPRVTRAMNSVASEEAFRLKIDRAMKAEGDTPLYLAAGVGRPGTPEGDHGYTHSSAMSLDPDADVIDLPTRNTLKKESEAKRQQRINANLRAMREVRDVLEQKIKEHPDLVVHVGKYLWQIRGRINECERALKRKIAA